MPADRSGGFGNVTGQGGRLSADRVLRSTTLCEREAHPRTREVADAWIPGETAEKRKSPPMPTASPSISRAEPPGDPQMIESKYVAVDGVNTHYLEAGDPDAPTVALLHSGEFGGCAEISWEFAVPALAEHFHVVAPDWLGFGRTDKVFDFADPRVGG